MEQPSGQKSRSASVTRKKSSESSTKSVSLGGKGQARKDGSVKVEKVTPKKRSKRKRKPGITPKRFSDTLIRVLGEMTGFEPSTPVDYKEVIPRVIAEAKLTEKELEIADKAAKRSVQPSVRKYLHRQVGLAFRARRDNYVINKTPLTVQVGESGQWGLTEDGVEKAKQLCGEDDLPPEP